jgi:hypothetical protein
MITQDEYAKVIETLFMEVQGTFSILTQADIQRLPALAEELREARATLQDPRISDEDILGIAFGLVDEYIHAKRDDVIATSYALYLDILGAR